jgi:RNA polymerase sigma-70 factor
MPVDATQNLGLTEDCESVLREIYTMCAREAPNFGVSEGAFRENLLKTAVKYLYRGNSADPVSGGDLAAFFRDLQAREIFLAMACAQGNEFAWFDFDQQYRPFIERVARHLASSDADASDVVETVYVELYGTRIVDGMRVSKFASYSGRGSLKGWLRTVVWHSLVDLHRAGHDEVSLDEMTETVGEGQTHAHFSGPARGGEVEAIDEINRNRYRAAAKAALAGAFASLGDHEKLLLLYYHVENLKLREIARLVEAPGSPLRSAFQRRAKNNEDAGGRTHESTVMRWLEKTYEKVLHQFKEHLVKSDGLKPAEIDICLQLAASDMAVDMGGVISYLSAN